MNFLRKILFPFSVLYGSITGFRNFLYDNGLLKSNSFNLPVIAVGNLSVGGTGKTPQIEYLIRLLSGTYKVATLSRGYKRKSEGFVLADASSSATILGDEPYQFYKKFPEIMVAVDANRTNGITQLLAQTEKPEVILLDDAYQHRKVKAGFYILLTAYGDLYVDDLILPAGNLRESRNGVERAAIVVVTKCPQTVTQIQQNEIRTRLKLKPKQQLFFTYIKYDDNVYSENHREAVSTLDRNAVFLVAGIAKPQPFFDHLKVPTQNCMTFPDHHHFTEKDIAAIMEKANGKKIITTEKDYVRLEGRLPSEQLLYLPIVSAFLNNENDFNKTILDYVGASTRNR